jgi:predicted 2-oxoglutarate/Fe(II)-dependent dioxygenase YbiX
MEQTQTDSTTPEIVFDQQESKYRLIEENFISPEECQSLIHLIDTYGKVGDGYGGNAHPHSQTETFGGYSFAAHLKTVETPAPGHKEALAIILKARERLKSHFNLPYLWLDYSHLLFRQPTEGTDAEHEKFSHPWHYDNQSEGVKHRTHTAIIYLNDEFEGGHTCFQKAEFGPYREVSPTPGVLVGFDCTKNDHAVTKLTSGKRYAMISWFSTHWRMLPNHRKIFK